MISIVRQILTCFTRYVFYGTLKLLVVRSLKLIPFVRDVASGMTISELWAVMQNEQLIGIILLRELYASRRAYVSYVLFRLLLSDNPIEFIWKFSLYTGMKCVLRFYCKYIRHSAVNAMDKASRLACLCACALDTP